MNLDDELDAYQAYLEAVRAHPEDEQLWDDLQRARNAVEIAWLEQLMTERNMMTDPPVPKAAPSKANVLLHDSRVVLGAVVAAAEAVLVALPTGPLHDAFQVGVPLASAAVVALASLGD